MAGNVQVGLGRFGNNQFGAPSTMVTVNSNVTVTVVYSAQPVTVVPT